MVAAEFTFFDFSAASIETLFSSGLSNYTSASHPSLKTADMLLLLTTD